MSTSDINAINQALANIQSSFNSITGNTLSSYNQLSRIVSQQSNIYNTIYYGTGNLTTGNLSLTGNLIGFSNIILPSGSRMTIGSTTINDRYDLSISGNLNVATSMRSGTMGQFGNITYHFASDSTPLYSTVGTGRNLILNHSTYHGSIGPNYPNPECMLLMTNSGTPNIFHWGMYTGIVKDLASTNPSNSLRMDFGSINELSTNLNNTGGNTITPQMTLRYTGNLGTLGINRTNPLYALDVNGDANISGNLNVNDGTFWVDNTNIRVGILNTNPQYDLDVKGSANISNYLYVGGASPSESTRVIIKNDIIDTVTNGTTSGTSINMLALNNNARNWYFGSDGTTNNQFYLGSSGGQANDPDYFCYWDTSGRMMVYPPTTGSITAPNSTDLFTVRGTANISGNIYSSTGYIPLCRASISFRYASSTLTTFYSNNCSVARNGVASYTITLTNPPNSTNYTVACWASATAGTTITQAFTSNAVIATVGYKTNTQTLIWISNNNDDTGIDPANLCEVHFFW